ncbi:MAG: hypothetical protein BWY74_02253 [Firmicutes bacterium ADurb.Bin419]|nr:MAG: hypothetical protein BWY74_02253 [Firmicutes bacterium ADurb.Bin419]
MGNEFFYRIFKKLLWLRVPLAFVTAIFVIVMGVFFKYLEMDFNKNAVKTLATITAYNDYGYPILSYNVGEKEYTVSSRSLITNSQVGDKVEIKYHKNNPTYIESGENALFEISIWMIVIGTVGALFIALVFFKR